MASDAKFTPGPWVPRLLYRMIRWARESPGEILIVSDPEDDWANARLMAAAPVMLAALESILNFVPSRADDLGACAQFARHALAVANAAIASATVDD